MTQATIFPIYVRSEYRNDGKAFQAFQSDAKRAAQAAKRELAGVGAALDQALSRPRNAAGSLDLGVDELRRAAAAQQQLAIAAREVAEATRRAATANGGFDASLSQATRTAFAYAAAQERSSAEMLQQVAVLERVQAELGQVASASNSTAVAMRRGTAATGQQRAGLQQLSFQLNDVATMFALGARPQQIFASQAGQVIQAIQMMTGGTSRLAAFLGGPWGLAITSAAVVLTPFIGKLLEGDEASEKLSEGLDQAKFAADGMASAQSILGNVIDLTTGKLREQTGAAITLARAQLQLAEVRARVAADEARGTLQAASRRTVQVDIASVGTGSFGGSVFRSVRRPSVSAAAAQRALAGDVDGALDALKEAVDTGKTTAAIYAETATAIANLGVESENIKRFGKALQALEGDQAAISEFVKPGRTRSGRSAEAEARRAAREAEQLATFGNQAAEQIQRLNERFSEQPRLITQAAQATRQLDAIIAELSERKPANFEAMIKDAEKAKRSVEEALLRPFEMLRQESEQRLKIEELLAAGREDEAAALQEVLRVKQQIGRVSEEQRREIEGIVRAEAERVRYLRDQQALFLAQLDVVQTVRRDLSDLLSGRSANLFGNFRQALRDLQGQRLFETIFGDTFRQIEEELRGNSPQGRANARYAAEVEKTALATERLGDALDGLTSRISAANDNAGAGFNPQVAMVQAALQAVGIGTGITVTGSRRQPAEIGRLSINELADRISQGIAGPLEGIFEDVFGPRFAGVFGDIVGGAIKGQVLGGDVGSVLGGLQGLTSNVKGLGGVSDLLGKAGAGAAVGSQVAGIGKLLGIKGSTTGAQLGGAIGSVTGIPGGDIIGAIAGNILGGLLKGTPRGSATIGGLGGALGITGTRGNSSSRREAASGLAGSVLDVIDSIADQLGASVDASRGSVSLGVRNDNIRLDRSGRGITKTRNGAIDFGDDAEGAIRAAVLDLIQDGVIAGLRASEQRLLQAANDVEAGLRDVLSFRSVFDRLREIKDPVGFAVSEVEKEFDRLRDLFSRANATAAELADLEELAGIERARAIEDATRRVVGSLQGLLDNLRIGDSGLSLRSRRANALGQFNDLAGRVAAGDASAFDDFADISQQLLDIERQLFGSTQSYFDRLAQITALTEQAIADQTNVTSIGAAAASAVEDRAAITRSIDVQTDALASRLDTLNANLIAALDPLTRVAFAGNSRGEVSPRLVSNF
jgi:hypothetical protein